MPAGAHCKLTPELQKKLIECIESGLVYDIACDAVGIDSSTFYRWLREGKANLCEEKNQFYWAIKKAKANCAKNLLDIIKKHGIKEWTASAWLLERRYRKYYGKDAKELKEVLKLIRLLGKGEPTDGNFNEQKEKQAT